MNEKVRKLCVCATVLLGLVCWGLAYVAEKVQLKLGIIGDDGVWHNAMYHPELVLSLARENVNSELLIWCIDHLPFLSGLVMSFLTFSCTLGMPVALIAIIIALFPGGRRRFVDRFGNEYIEI